jgi:hypothetical protein
MGQLAIALRNPENQGAFRTEGGQFEYGSPIHMIEDLIATRRTWRDEVTILADDIPVESIFGYVAFWEPDTPTLGFKVSRAAVDGCGVKVARDLFLYRNRHKLMNLVEREAKRGFDLGTDKDARSTSWSRLMQDDESL